MNLLTDHPAVAFNFESAPTAQLRDAFEVLRDCLVEAPNKQASYAAVSHLSSLYSLLKQAC